jgi:hypothetical protein
MMKKFKSFLSDDLVFTVLLVLLVGVVAFGLGRQSVSVGAQKMMPVATIRSEFEMPTTSVSPLSEPLVASKSGSKYHLQSCPGATQIKPENVILFASVAEAVAAGYTPAANCPDLH